MADRNRTALDWEDVRFFAALARHGSFSAAARALGVNHATVARRIGALEAALGVRLFERRPSGYELTDAGRSVLPAVGAMESAAHIVAHAPAAESSLRELVRITATPSLGEAFLIPRLVELRTAYPGIDIELIADRRSVSLSRHEADLGLRLARPADGDLVARRIATLDFGFFATPESAARLAAGAAPVFVGFDESSAHLPEAVWMSRHFAGTQFALRSNSQSAQAVAASAGWGIALLPRFLARAYPSLIEVDLGGDRPTRELWLLARPDGIAGSPAGVVRRFLIELFGREQAAFRAG